MKVAAQVLGSTCAPPMLRSLAPKAFSEENSVRT